MKAMVLPEIYKDHKECSDDDALLTSLGYEKKLHRGLSALSNFAFGFTEVAVLASITSLYGFGLQTGGEERSFLLE